MPMIIMQGDYIFPVHDGLDSIGKVQIIRNCNLEFHPYENMPIMGNMPVFFANIGANIYYTLIYNMDYIPAIIINMLLYVSLGYF